MRTIVVATLGVRSDGRGPSSVHCILPRRRDSRPDFRTGGHSARRQLSAQWQSLGSGDGCRGWRRQCDSADGHDDPVSGLFALLSEIFQFVRWAGALYLIWLGVKSWQVRGVRQFASMTAARRSWHSVFLQGFLIAITNPKAIVSYIAFLPQFVDPKLPLGPRLLALIGTMIIVGLLFDGDYALLAGRARRWLSAPGRLRLQGRISGALLIGIGCGIRIILNDDQGRFQHAVAA